MIVTVTPNPSIDRTVWVDRLERGAVIRATDASSEAGGKGVNVARALSSGGVPAVAVVPLAEDSEASYGALVRAAVPCVAVPVRGAVRVNVSLVEPDGTVTKVNEPGPVMTGAEVERLLACVASEAHGASWIVGCGSLSPGMPADFYARLAELRSPARRIAVDASGPALREAGSVDLVKPNRAELEELAGEQLETLGDIVRAARRLVETGTTSVLVSLGRDGALYLDRDVARHAEALIADVVNPVGAGDALLAGYLAAGGGPAALRTAVAWSVAACRSPGTRMNPPTARDAGAVTEHDMVDVTRRLSQ